MNKIDLIIHPVRIKIVQQLVVNGAMTTTQLREILKDIPQATLYRHVKLLYQVGIIRIAKTRKVNGKQKHVYELALEELRALQSDTDISSHEEHIQYFSTFLSVILKQATSYLTKHPPSQYQKDGFNYWYALMYLTDQEFEEVANSIDSIIKEAMTKKKTPKRKLRGYAYMYIPTK